MSRARALRKKSTDAEIKLWSHLRDRRLAGHKFRRQHPVDAYGLDFFCFEKNLAVEVDGSGNAEVKGKAHDEERDAYLKSKGIRVIRFANWDVFEELDSVLERISRELRVRESKSGQEEPRRESPSP